MKIRNKLGLLLGGALLSFTVVVLFIIGGEMINSSRTEIEAFRENEMERYQQILVNYVDLAYHSIISQATRSEDHQYLIDKYGDRLRNTVEAAESIILAELKKAESGQISRREAIDTAREMIRAFRYDDGTGYLWINDTEFPYPNMVMHPIIPSLEGTTLDNPSYNVAMGTRKNLFQAFVEETEDDGEGFVDYTWPRPTEDGLSEDQPKLSYVKRIEELNWIIGTGIYVSDALIDIKLDVLLQLEMMRYDNGIGYYWINDIGKPYPRMVMHPVLSELDGQILNNDKYNVVGDEKKNLFKAFVDETEDDNEGFVTYLWPKPLENGISEDQPKLSFVKRFPEWNWIIGTGFYIDDLDKSVAEKERVAMIQLRRSILLILLSAFLLAVFFIFVAYGIIRRMVRPVSEAAEMFEQMSRGEGDLSVRLIKKSNDEAGAMALNFNSFLEKLKRIVVHLKDAVNSTKLVKDSLGKTAEYTADEVKKINTAVIKMEKRIALLDDRISQSDAGTEEVDKRLERLSTRIKTETRAVENASQSVTYIVDSIKEVAHISQQRRKAMDKLIISARTGSELLHTTYRAVNDIFAQIDGIKEMVDLIENISSQTNLLAMNAAIEAAHAGDAGKGFAVVADEITKLAENTNESSQQISQSLEEIVESVRKAGDASEKTSKTFLDVEDEVGNVTESLDEITRSTGEISQNGDGVMVIMEELAELSEGVNRDTTIIGNQSRNIKKGMGEAGEVSKGIRHSINSVALSMEEIARAMDKLLVLTDDLTSTSETMNRQAKKFKIE